MKEHISIIDNDENNEIGELADVCNKLREIRDCRFYCAPYIPESRQEYARWSYAADINPETPVIALVDNTFWKTAKYGCFFTASRFYSNDRKFGIKRCAISGGTVFSVEKNKFMINGAVYMIFSRRRSNAMKKLAEALQLLAGHHD